MLGTCSVFFGLFLATACVREDRADPSADAGSTGTGGHSANTGGSSADAGSTSTGGHSANTGGSAGTSGPVGGSAGSSSTDGTGGTSSSGSGGTAGTASGGTGAGATGGGGAGGGATAGTTGAGGQVATGLPDPGSDGDGDSTIASYTTQSDLTSKGNPKGKTFSVQVTSKIFDGKDSTLRSPASATRTVQAYVPAMYKDGTPAPLLIIQDGPGELSQVSNALDNLTISADPMRKLPPFIIIAVPNGGGDSIGSERGLEYDTLSDRHARFITEEVMPAVQTSLKAMYPNFKFDPNPSGRATLGCSSGAAAAFTMAWFRPDLFSRVIAYSATLVAQQDPKAPESAMYPHGAWDYHSDLELIKNDKLGREKKLRIFHNANQNDNGATAPESGRHNWLMANMRTAAALKAKGFHYKFVEGLGQGHCAGQVQSATLADALVWVWRGYQPPVN